MSSYRTTFTVDQTPDEVFAAIADVRSWWTGDIEGDTAASGAEFTYRYGDLHESRQRITEFVPGERVVWLVVDSLLSFAQDKSEWTGTRITFDITPTDDGTEVRFTHDGLVPAFECYDACSGAWGFYVTSSLRDRIGAGAGQAVQP